MPFPPCSLFFWELTGSRYITASATGPDYILSFPFFNHPDHFDSSGIHHGSHAEYGYGNHPLLRSNIYLNAFRILISSVSQLILTMCMGFLPPAGGSALAAPTSACAWKAYTWNTAGSILRPCRIAAGRRVWNPFCLTLSILLYGVAFLCVFPSQPPIDSRIVFTVLYCPVQYINKPYNPLFQSAPTCMAILRERPFSGTMNYVISGRGDIDVLLARASGQPQLHNGKVDATDEETWIRNWTCLLSSVFSSGR